LPDTRPAAQAYDIIADFATNPDPDGS